MAGNLDRFARGEPLENVVLSDLTRSDTLPSTTAHKPVSAVFGDLAVLLGYEPG